MKNNIKNLTIYSLFLYAFFSTISITISEIFFIAGILLWIIDTAVNKRDLKNQFPLYIGLPVLFFTIMHLISAITGLDPSESLKDFRKVYIFLIMFFAGYYLQSGNNVKRAFDFFIAGATVVGIYAIVSTIKFRYLGHNPDFRAASFSGNHMHAGGMLMMALIVNSAMLAGFLKKLDKKLTAGILYSISFVLIALGLAFTFTRGSWFAALAGILIIAFLADKRAVIAIVVVVLLVGFLLKDTFFMRRIKDTVNISNGTSAIERVYMWQSGIQIIKDYPLHGIGTSNVGKVYPKYKKKDARELNEGHLHNNLIQVSVIDGIPGLLVFLWLFTVLWIFSAGLLKSTRNTLIEYEAYAIFPISVAFFINGFFEYNLFSSQVATIFWFIMGAGIAIKGSISGQESAGQRNKRKIETDKLQRALIIRTRAIGDILLTTPFIRTLKKRIPNIEIDYLCEPLGLPILQGNPYLNSIIAYEKNKLQKGAPSVRIKETFRLYADLRKRKYDIVFDLFGNLRTALMSFLTGARYRVGFTFRGRQAFYNIKVKPDIEPKYNVFYHMDLLKAINVENDGERLDFYFENEDKTYIESFLSAKKISNKDVIIGLNPAGSWPTKRWPEQKFSELADMLVEDVKESKLIIIWGPGEAQMADSIITGMKGDKSRVFIAPDTSIKQLGALIKQMRVLITNDGAPKHIADALDTPTVAIFGPTNYKSWNPVNNAIHIAVTSGIECAPCDKTECHDIKCMESIRPEQVLGYVKKLLKI